ncbi:hypothetical protein L345_09406, partial [Ophiophagus hannah]
MGTCEEGSGSRRDRLIGRKKQRDGGGGSASSLRGLERVHARGQRCRAGVHSTNASQLKQAQERRGGKGGKLFSKVLPICR